MAVRDIIQSILRTWRLCLHVFIIQCEFSTKLKTFYAIK